MVDEMRLVEKISDRSLLKFFRELCEIIDAPSFNIKQHGSPTPLNFSISEEGEIEDNAFWQHDGQMILTAAMTHQRFSVQFNRGVDPAAPYSDTLRIHNAQNDQPNRPVKDPVTEVQLVAINRLIDRSFPVSPDRAVAIQSNPRLFRDLMSSHQRMIEKLQETTLAVGEQIAEARANLEEEAQQRRSSLESEFESRQSDADAATRQERERLREVEEALRQREQEIDDRSNTHARRDLYNSLKTKVQERSAKFEVTPETRGTRRPIHIGVWVSAIALMVLLFLTLQTPVDGFQWDHTIRIAGLTIALLGLMGWYLRWMNRWSERHAETEFHLKQFDLDIDRASWAVELALEWRVAQDNPMPEQLIETITRNLFTRSEKPDDSSDMHPADYLASALLGRASALRVKTPMAEIDFDKKLLKQAGQGTE